MRERALELAMTFHANDDVSPEMVIETADIFLLFLEADEVTE